MTRSCPGLLGVVPIEGRFLSVGIGIGIVDHRDPALHNSGITEAQEALHGRPIPHLEQGPADELS